MLLDWLDEARLDRVGAFRYEPVAGAEANGLGLDPFRPRSRPRATSASCSGHRRSAPRSWRRR